MSKKKTSSEIQARIQQRYEDTALCIYHQQNVKKRSTSLSSPRTRQAFDEYEVNDPGGQKPAQPGPSRAVDAVSQICVVM